MMKEREERWVSIASRLAKRGETKQWYSAVDAATMSTQMSVAASGQVSRGGGAALPRRGPARPSAAGPSGRARAADRVEAAAGGGGPGRR